jgi:hypothetical protein
MEPGLPEADVSRGSSVEPRPFQLFETDWVMGVQVIPPERFVI